MLYDKELDENLKVCLHCTHHFPITARERINSLVETCSFEEMDAEMTSVDMLKFTGVASYSSKLEDYQRTTELRDAVITGFGRIGPHRTGLGVMDFGISGRIDGIGGGRETHPADRERRRRKAGR